ncbi:MAG: signal recognition particle-docking protein FtsY [Victivallaceae bacterium]|nr:signal recognition particle-docking protein FtsY [Victivallaceae bacterium]
MKSIFSVFRRGLEKTAVKVGRSISGVFTGIKAHGDASFEELEALLVSADFGVAAAQRIAADVRDEYERGTLDTDADLAAAARRSVKKLLEDGRHQLAIAPANTPTVILFAGVNGSGKTTTIGKLASLLVSEKKKVILAACDTFRAAAVEQLQLWGERTSCQVVASKHGADPAGVAFDAVKAAQARGADFLLIDTAGRQQNQKNLMDELTKIRRAVDKALPGAPHETLLTVDASLGGNVISQAREFSRSAGVTGLVITKLDGTGRGGMAVALKLEFGLPVFFIGLGEQPGDLQPFDPEYYAAALFGGEASDEQ